jgi:hypothetical protein
MRVRFDEFVSSVKPVISRPARLIIPWGLFFVFLLSGWRMDDLFHTVPAYGDILEFLWGTLWYDKAFTQHISPFFYPLVFYPAGWQVSASANAPAVFMILLPFYYFGGAAFAYNVVALLALFVAFAGMYRFARCLTTAFPATIAALLFTFWGMRWVRIEGHLNILIASALLPWILWAVERGLHSARRKTWFVVVGLLWALSIAVQFYFVFIAGVLLAGWVIARWLSRQINWRLAVSAIAIPVLIAIVLNIPNVIWFWQGRAAAGATFSTIYEPDAWGASLNSLPIPDVVHPYPWLRSIANSVYHGTMNESSRANFGLVSSLVVLVSLRWFWSRKDWRPLVIVTFVGIILALGITLKWNGESVQWEALRPLDDVIWQIGHRLKPDIFASNHPSPPFDTAIPLPGLLLTAIVPFWEGARTVVRYSFIAGPAFFVLAVLGMTRLRSRWAQLFLAILLLIEVVPYPYPSVPFPPANHPAFEWLRQQSLSQQSLIDLYIERPNALYMPIRGETLFATLYHNKPTVAGTSSVWPAHMVFLNDWLLQHPHPFQNPTFLPVLRYYGVRFILLHMHGAGEQAALDEAKQNPEAGNIRCFSPPTEPSPWPYPICVIEVLPSRTSYSNVIFQKNWSGGEDWGIWATDTESHAKWVATSQLEQNLSVEAFPQCVPGRPQNITFEVNGAEIGAHQWNGCGPWSDKIVIPKSLIRIGWNDLVIRTAYAVRPADITNGQNGDTRKLSVGFTNLRIEPVDAGDRSGMVSPLILPDQNMPPLRSTVSP